MSKKLFIYILVGLAFISIVIFWVAGKYSAPKIIVPAKLSVTASFYPLYFFAQQIGGVKAEVANIVPAGAEPHDYEPSASDLAGMENSQLIILNGGGLEAWGGNVQDNIDHKKTIIVVAGDGLTTQQVTEGGQSGIDPHVWLAPPLAEKMVSRILQGFIQADPANQTYYQTQAQNLQARLESLDAAYRQGLSQCSDKNIITSHEAFGYLSTTYGLRQIAIAGLSPDAEPSPQQLADIVKLAKANQIKYIFFESLASPKLAQTIATEIGAQTLGLDPLEGLTPEEAAQGQDYLTIMRANLINLQKALGCR
jgi:zinc transport system substrate-binding protein